VFLTLLASEDCHGALAYRNKTYTTSSSSTTGVTATEPAGTAQNDIIFAFFVGNGTLTVTPPANWNTLASVAVPNGITVKLYWIRRGASAPSYAFSWDPSSYYELSITSWSGAETTGNPYDTYTVGTPTQASPGNPNCPAVTTTVANTLVLAFGMDWNGFNGGGAGPPTGYTLVEGQTTYMDLAIAYKAKATIGSEDPSAFTNAYPTNSDIVGITVALKPPATSARVRHRVFAD
jgi:hypothetical protein